MTGKTSIPSSPSQTLNQNIRTVAYATSSDGNTSQDIRDTRAPSRPTTSPEKRDRIRQPGCGGNTPVARFAGVRTTHADVLDHPRGDSRRQIVANEAQDSHADGRDGQEDQRRN